MEQLGYQKYIAPIANAIVTNEVTNTLMQTAAQFGIDYSTVKIWVHPEPDKMVAAIDDSNSGWNAVGVNRLSSKLGTPIYDRYVILTDVVKDTNLLIEHIIINTKKSRTIVKTPIYGRDDTIKEFITNGDVEITMRGGFFGTTPNNRNTEDIVTLKTLSSIGRSIEISNTFLNDIGVNNIVIESINLSESDKYANAIFYEINALSDSPEKFISST